MNDEKTVSRVTIPLGIAQIALWIYVAYGEGESGPINLKAIGDKTNIPLTQVYPKMTHVCRQGLARKIPGEKAHYGRKNGLVRISDRSMLDPYQAFPGIVLKAGEDYDLAKLADDFRNTPEAKPVIKELTTNLRKVESKRAKSAAAAKPVAAPVKKLKEGPSSITQAAHKIVELAQVIKELKSNEAFSFSMIGDILSEDERNTLLSWLDPVLVPETADTSSGPEAEELLVVKATADPSSEKTEAIADQCFEHCLNAIREICDDGCSSILALYASR